MLRLTIRGSKEFIDEIVKAWGELKPYLDSLGREVQISENKILKVNAYLNLRLRSLLFPYVEHEKIVISCDNPTLGNIRPLTYFVRVQLSVRREYKNFYSQILLKHFEQVNELTKKSSEIADFVESKYGEFMGKFLKYLFMSLERALSLERLSDEEKGDLGRVESIREPFKERVKKLSRLDLYLVMVNNLWRRAFGWRPPDFVLSAGVDMDGLERMFDTVLDVLRFQRYTMAGRAAYAITEFTFRIFGININEILPLKTHGKDYYVT